MHVGLRPARGRLEARLRFETFVADTALRLAADMPAERVVGEIETALQQLRGLAGADACALLGAGPRERVAWVTCASYVEGLQATLPPGNLAIPFPWLCTHLCGGGSPLVVTRLSELPPEAAIDRQSAAAIGLRSLLAVHVDHGDPGAHCLLLYRTRRTARWRADLPHRLPALARIFVVALDRERARRTREQLEQRHADLLASVRAIIWRADARTFQTTFVSREAEAILGYPLESWLKVPGFWKDHIHPDDVERVLALTGEATREGRAHDFEYRMIAGDGRTVWVRNIVTVIMRDDVPSEVAGVTVDITPRKVAEFEAAQLRHQLAHVLRVASLGELAATLAHELSQPLGAIVSNAETAALYLDRPGPPLDQLRSVVGDIASDGRRAGAVLQRVWNLLRPQVPDPHPFDVRSTVEHVVELVRPLAAARGVDVTVSVANDLPPVRGDAVQIQQVLLNLILNAMDAVGERSTRPRDVRIDAVGRESGVEVSVTDNGPGIPPHTLPRVFDPFFSTKGGGLGMGLPICRSIVSSHGGTIRIEANPAGGTSVRVVFPACAGEGAGA